ncbi:TetR/AcrR family transcriptional regulator [Pontibacter roseus]|uniref:TetR/AcrR family transcriptional regulator n=1 Tax=Pontibacter roseus TaxID=336989 RepID=UPI000370CA65|nr:TetR/AcrR family transcriptional regulator [Pontibacter roseus]
MNKFQEKREQSVGTLVEVALRLFAQKGYEATSIRAIASEAGMSLGLLYNYFSGKEQLLEEIFRQGIRDVQATLSNQTEQQTDSRIARHIQQTVQLLKEKKDFWRLLHGIRMQSPVVKRLLVSMQAETEAIETSIRQNLEQDGFGNVAIEAKLLFAAIDGMAHHFLLFDDYPIDEVAQLLILKYSKGKK